MSINLAAVSAPLCAGGVGILGEVAAGVVAASGGGDIAEGIQDLFYGWNGDSETESFNLVRDTLYQGNETIYETSTGIAAACGDIGLLAKKNVLVNNKCYSNFADSMSSKDRARYIYKIMKQSLWKNSQIEREQLV